MDENYEAIFFQICLIFLASSWWLQSFEVFTYSIIHNPYRMAAISMHIPNPMLGLFIHARFIP
jgi:hypothetical protein